MVFFSRLRSPKELTQGSETHTIGSGDQFRVRISVPWVSGEVVFFSRLRSPKERTQGSETHTIGSGDQFRVRISVPWVSGELVLSFEVSEFLRLSVLT